MAQQFLSAHTQQENEQQRIHHDRIKSRLESNSGINGPGEDYNQSWDTINQSQQPLQQRRSEHKQKCFVGCLTTLLLLIFIINVIILIFTGLIWSNTQNSDDHEHWSDGGGGGKGHYPSSRHVG